MALGPTPRTPLATIGQGGALLVIDSALYPQKVYFVDNSVTAAVDDAFHGRSWDIPWKTLAYGVGQAAANDTIVIGSGHSETTAAAAGINVNKSGLHLIGACNGGRALPAVQYITLAAASFDINSANVVIENMLFDSYTNASSSSASAMVNVKAANVTIRNCLFNMANATTQAVLGILTTTAANYLTVENCVFFGTSDAGTTAAIKIVGGNSIRIRNNTFHGAYTSGVGAIQGLTTDTKGLLVQGNQINNLTASCTKAMVFTTASTGQITGNGMQILSGTAPITGAAMSWAGSPANYYAAVIGTGSTIV